MSHSKFHGVIGTARNTLSTACTFQLIYLWFHFTGLNCLIVTKNHVASLAVGTLIPYLNLKECKLRKESEKSTQRANIFTPGEAYNQRDSHKHHKYGGGNPFKLDIEKCLERINVLPHLCFGHYYSDNQGYQNDILTIAQHIMQTRANIKTLPFLAGLLSIYEVLYRPHRAHPATENPSKQDCRHNRNTYQEVGWESLLHLSNPEYNVLYCAQGAGATTNDETEVGH